jgi:ankyrin repeat protein
MHKTSRSLELGVVIVLVTIAAVVLFSKTKPQPVRPQFTSLREAVIFDAEQIPRLVAAGEPLDKLDADGHTLLWVAARHRKPDAVRRLVKLGVDPNEGGTNADPPLLVATFVGRTSECELIVKQLIAAGADVNAVSQQYDETALHYAVRNKNHDVALLLVHAGADVNLKSSMGNTPLQFAVVNGDPDTAGLLLKSGADPELRNDVGFRPIDQLNACPNPKEVQAAFRANGADDQRRPELIAASRATRER